MFVKKKLLKVIKIKNLGRNKKKKKLLAKKRISYIQ